MAETGLKERSQRILITDSPLMSRNMHQQELLKEHGIVHGKLADLQEFLKKRK